MEKAGSNPAFDTRTGMRPGEGLHAARRGVAAERERRCVVVTGPISPVPQRTFQLMMRKHRQGGGEDVCYFVSKTVARKGGTASPVPRLHSPRSVVKIAVTSSVKREVAGSNPARRHVRR